MLKPDESLQIFMEVSGEKTHSACLIAKGAKGQFSWVADLIQLEYIYIYIVLHVNVKDG